MLRRRFLAAISATCILASFPAGQSAIAMDGHAPRPAEGNSKTKCAPDPGRLTLMKVERDQAESSLRRAQSDVVLAKADLKDANKQLNRELRKNKPDAKSVKRYREKVAVANLKVREAEAMLKRQERSNLELERRLYVC